MHKEAGGDSPWSIFVPLHRTVFGLNPNVDKLPKVLGSREANSILWSTLGQTLSLGAIAATATVLANKVAESAWDKKRKAIHENKVNALYSYNAPNTAPDVQAVKEVREIGLKEPKQLENKETKLLENKEPMEKAAGTLAEALVPPLIAVPAAFAIGSLAKEVIEEDRGEKLDKEIAELRNKLDRLYARSLELRGVEKTAAGDEKPNVLGRMATAAVLGPLALATITGYATYLYTKKKDENRQKLKMLEETVLPQNLTNTPAEMQLVLNDKDKLPTTRSEQNYIEDLQDKAAKL